MEMKRFPSDGKSFDSSPALAELAARLDDERPLPRAGFRARLRNELIGAEQRAPGPRVLVAYAASGALLLAFALAGVAGLGPLSAG
jgi:hypothetical protein